MTSLKTSIKTITYLSDTGCLEIQGASLVTARTGCEKKAQASSDRKNPGNGRKGGTGCEDGSRGVSGINAREA
ncbi:hypothetical protein GFA27_15345 [Salmonella enterica]|nr:hypothetical protein [Salmonella enterica subsp. enterica serovar Worthington]EBZ4697760.1 hypothetical protein [Salmonella enterica subsp. enterica serovar Saintpaul]ECG7980981.1 hypothetical protein [Salmonella enterica]ECO8810212.1 hypothetical protein [Salmonella enterica subsp. enterica serovar Schwarzengrund]EDJ3846226.1 hypothetical protein [Salmonella enterica subsp. enterica serovar Muenchen]HAB5965528.1 hypothetical protein [Salmonella enterica subsp. enterica]